jgi:hypothetical protein
MLVITDGLNCVLGIYLDKDSPIGQSANRKVWRKRLTEALVEPEQT